MKTRNKELLLIENQLKFLDYLAESAKNIERTVYIERKKFKEALDFIVLNNLLFDQDEQPLIDELSVFNRDRLGQMLKDMDDAWPVLTNLKTVREKVIVEAVFTCAASEYVTYKKKNKPNLSVKNLATLSGNEILEVIKMLHLEDIKGGFSRNIKPVSEESVNEESVSGLFLSRIAIVKCDLQNKQVAEIAKQANKKSFFEKHSSKFFGGVISGGLGAAVAMGASLVLGAAFAIPTFGLSLLIGGLVAGGIGAGIGLGIGVAVGAKMDADRSEELKLSEKAIVAALIANGVYLGEEPQVVNPLTKQQIAKNKQVTTYTTFKKIRTSNSEPRKDRSDGQPNFLREGTIKAEEMGPTILPVAKASDYYAHNKSRFHMKVNKVPDLANAMKAVLIVPEVPSKKTQ